MRFNFFPVGTKILEPVVHEKMSQREKEKKTLCSILNKNPSKNEKEREMGTVVEESIDSNLYQHAGDFTSLTRIIDK